METLSFDKLPEAVAQLFEKLNGIEQLLQERHTLKQPKEEDQFLDTEQAGKFLNLSVPTLYGLVHRKQIPVFKRGKQLRFSKELLTDWVKSGRKQTQAEIDLQSDLHLLNLKKGGN